MFLLLTLSRLMPTGMLINAHIVGCRNEEILFKKLFKLWSFIQPKFCQNSTEIPYYKLKIYIESLFQKIITDWLHILFRFWYQFASLKKELTNLGRVNVLGTGRKLNVWCTFDLRFVSRVNLEQVSCKFVLYFFCLLWKCSYRRIY